MKTTILCFVVSCLIPLHGFAGPSLKDAVNRRVAMFERSKHGRKPVVYPELGEKLEGIFFRHPIAHIVVNGVSEKGKNISTHIYIKGEEIYVIQANEGWNLAANNAGVFEWEKGTRHGIKIKRNDDDLVAYIYYLTDPSYMMAGIYYSYLTSPNRFAVVQSKDKKWIELRLKEPNYGFEAIYVSKKPLWFYGLRVRNPPTGRGQAKEIMISEPKDIKEVPAELTRQLEGVRFEDSTLTLQRHMTFL